MGIIYKLIFNVVYNKCIGLVHEHKEMSEKYSFFAIKYNYIYFLEYIFILK